MVTYFLKSQAKGSKKRPVALDPQKKIPFKLIDKKVSTLHCDPLDYLGVSWIDAERISGSPVSKEPNLLDMKEADFILRVILFWPILEGKFWIFDVLLWLNLQKSIFQNFLG